MSGGLARESVPRTRIPLRSLRGENGLLFGGVTMIVRGGRLHFLLGLCLAIASFMPGVSMAAGAGSPFIHDGKVFFVQADDSIAVLSLEDGTPLRRHPRAGPMHTPLFHVVGESVAVFGHDSLVLLDAKTGEERGRFAGVDFRSAGDILLVLTARETVMAVSPGSGKVIWENSLGGAWLIDVAAEAGRIFVHGSLGRTKYVECLDARTGASLWKVHKDDAEDKRMWLRLLVSDDKVYMVCARQEEEGVSEAGADLVLSWTHDGQPRPPIQTGEKLAAMELYDAMSGPLEVDGHSFPANERFDRSWMARELIAEEAARFGDADAAAEALAYPVRDGGLLVVTMERHSGSRFHGMAVAPPRVVFLDPDRKWSGKAGYWRTPADRPMSVSGNEEVLLMTSTGGQLECMDRRTGSSRWVYLSPVGGSDRFNPFAAAMIPINDSYYVERRDDAADKAVGVTGMTPDGATRPSAPRVTADPLPDPFRRDAGASQGPPIMQYIIVLLLFAIPIAILDLWAFVWRPEWKPKGIALLLFMRLRKASSEAAGYGFFIPLFLVAYFFLGRYSWAMEATLLALTAVALVVSVCFAVIGLRRDGFDILFVVTVFSWIASLGIAIGIYAVYCLNAAPILNAIGSTFFF